MTSTRVRHIPPPTSPSTAATRVGRGGAWRQGYRTGGRTYQVQVRFRPTSGDAYVAALYELQAVEVLGV
jgi:hypothetical protein